MDPALLSAIVGIVFAIIALAGLAIYQQRQASRAKDAKLEAVRQSSAAGDETPAGATPFFVAQFRGNKACFYRVYCDDGALLFVNAGPYLISVDAETARGSDRRPWQVRAAKQLVIGLAAGAVAAVVGIAVVARAIARNPNPNPEAAGSILYGVVGVVALLAGGYTLAVPLVLWRITRRVAELDALSLRGLREQAEMDERSFRVTPDSISAVKLSHLKLDGPEVGALLTFKHKPTGSWKIETTTTRDTVDAVRAFQGLLGPPAVSVDGALATALSREKQQSSPHAEVAVSPRHDERGAISKVLPKSMPRFGYPRYMVGGFIVGAALAVAATYGLSGPEHPFRYTVLVRFLFAMGGLTIYLGHLVGALRDRTTLKQAAADFSASTLFLGAAICMIGTCAVFGIVLGIMTAIYGPAPH
jgi:hypothetical protein